MATAHDFSKLTAWKNGKLVPWGDLNIHVMTLGAGRGASVFEHIRSYWNESDSQLYFLKVRPHMERLFQSARLMRMRVDFTVDHLNEIALDLFRRNGFREDASLRPIIWLEDMNIRYLPEGCPSEVTFAVFPSLWLYGRKLQGIHCCVSSWTRVSDNSQPPRIKCAANYHNGRLATLEARMNGYDDGIFLNNRGKVCEGPGACLFMVKRGEVVTPPLTSDILESLTRGSLIRLFHEFLDTQVVEREVDRTELYIADELFFCGTGAEVTPILSVDKFPIGGGQVGPLTAKIQSIYFELARGQRPEHPEWRTPVYPR